MTASPRSSTSEGESSGYGSFEARWLAMVGVEPASLDERVDRANDRAGRYPWSIRLARWILVWSLDWLAPLVVLGRLRRARSLDRSAFEDLMEYVREHRWTTVRLAALGAVLPLMDVVADDEPPLQPDHPLEEPLAGHRPSSETRYDFVVIGTGAGGAPVATRLAEAGADVAIVEKGELVGAETTSQALERHYVDQGMLGVVRGTPIVVMAGETVGGTTSVNSGTSLRPSTERLEAWARELEGELGPDDIDPWLDEAAEALSVTVPPEEVRSRSSEVVTEGFEKLGREAWYPLPRNVEGCRGSGRCCFGCPTGAKQSTDRSFLPDALASGADLYAGWEATAIREPGDGVEVDVVDDGSRETLAAERLVVAAGAIYTPGLLRANRLGSAWRRAGDGFKTHPASKVFADVPGVERPAEFPGIPQGVGYDPEGIERVKMEGAELPTTAVGPVLPVGGGRFRRWIGRHDEIVSYGAMIRDRATGSVREWFGNPLISYEMHPDDARDMVRALKMVGEAFFAAGAREVLMPTPGLDPSFGSKEQLARLDPTDIRADDLLMSGFHPQGTAGIGRVVDTDLRLYGSERISVCDASVLPDSPGVNPQVTIVALSLRLADRLIGTMA